MSEKITQTRFPMLFKVAETEKGEPVNMEYTPTTFEALLISRLDSLDAELRVLGEKLAALKAV